MTRELDLQVQFNCRIPVELAHASPVEIGVWLAERLGMVAMSDGLSQSSVGQPAYRFDLAGDGNPLAGLPLRTVAISSLDVASRFVPPVSISCLTAWSFAFNEAVLHHL